MAISRNSLCPCGSGRKYKKCCLNKPKASPFMQAVEMPLVSNAGFLYRQAFLCLKVAISPLDDLVALKLGDVIVHITSKPQKVDVLVGEMEITNQYTANTNSVKKVSLEFNGSTYLILSYIAQTEDLAKQNGRLKFEVVLPYLEIVLGERFLFKQIYEQTIDIAKRQPVWISEADLNPGYFDIQNLKDEHLEIVLEQWDKLLIRPAEGRNRLELALRWYHRGLTEHVPDDKFLFFWVAFEVLTMPGTTDLNQAGDYLRERLFPDLERHVILSRLKLGALFGCRSDIIHNGLSKMNGRFDERICNLKVIVSELLRKEFGLAPLGHLEKLVR